MTSNETTAAPVHDVTVIRDVRIPTPDGDMTLGADLYRPRTVEPVPVLVSVLPYRKDFVGGTSLEGPARWFAARGFASVVVDLLGTGSSDGMRRPEFDPGEGDDAVAAIEWSADQPWCSGQVGMWGMSYSAVLALRAASIRPPHLRAILPLLHGLDPGRDTVHPDGARGDLHALVNRGTMMLAQQLLPPLSYLPSAAEIRRWQRRLRTAEPVFLDFARHRPGDPVWQRRAIDGEAIEVPAFCVGGWNDAFPDALIDAYERMRGPKKLLVGPWGHVLPNASVHEPVEFLSIAVRWWNHWLRGIDDGFLDEPPVTLYLGGHEPSWRAFALWPPASGALRLRTGDGPKLSPTSDAGPMDAQPTGGVVAEYQPDPTVGALRGLAGLGLGELCRPQDQHADDLRSVSLTSEPLGTALLICGRPEVVVSVRDPVDGGGRRANRLVVRLTEVDEAGRSSLITMGVLCHDGGTRHLVPLRPTAYRVAKGRRLRVSLGDSDFPRLTPLPNPAPFVVLGVELSLPTLTDDDGVRTDLPRVTTAPATSSANVAWTIARDHLVDGIEVAYRSRPGEAASDQGQRYEIGTEFRATVCRAIPSAAVTTGSHAARATLGTGQVATATATVHCTQYRLWARGELVIDEQTIFSRVWQADLDGTMEGAT